MPVPDKSEFLQWPSHPLIGEQECSRRRDLKVFGHHIFVYQAVGKSSPVAVNCFGIAAAYVRIRFVVESAVISRVAMVANTVEALHIQGQHLLAERVIIIAHGTAEQNIVFGTTIVRRHEIWRS